MSDRASYLFFCFFVAEAVVTTPSTVHGIEQLFEQCLFNL